MKVCHVTQYCHAGSSGGTERYILDLIHELERLGTESYIGWLSPLLSDTPFEADGVRVIPVTSPGSRVDPVTADFDGQVCDAFFDRECPDVLHLHTFGLAEATIARHAVRRGIPVVFTYHSPAWSCRRGTLLLWGRSPCDGEIRSQRCSACKLQQRLRVPAALSRVVCPLLVPVSHMFRRCMGGLRRRMSFIDDTARFRRKLREFLADCRVIVSCCDWSAPVLRVNGALEHQLVECPQGVSRQFTDAASRAVEASATVESGPAGTFDVGLVGRLTPEKGVHVVLKAFCATDYPAARLRIYGWERGARTDPYVRKLQAMAGEDRRVVFAERLSLGAMLAEYRRLSLVAIPSVWLETGPLVLLEALQMGVPVWGSRRVGQQKLLKESGRVVDPNTSERWQTMFESGFAAHARGEWAGVPDRDRRALRTMADVAREMGQVYEGIVPGVTGTGAADV